MDIRRTLNTPVMHTSDLHTRRGSYFSSLADDPRLMMIFFCSSNIKYSVRTEGRKLDSVLRGVWSKKSFVSPGHLWSLLYVVIIVLHL